MSLLLPKRKKSAGSTKYSLKEKLILERIQNVRDQFEQNKKIIKRKWNKKITAGT